MEYNFNWFVLNVINLVVLFCVVTEGRLRVGGYGGHIGYSLGAACEYDDDCLPAHSYCRRQEVCDCKRGFVPSDDGSQCLTLVGSFCQTNYDCSSLEHSECKQEMCQCEQRFVPNDGGSKCLPKAASYRSDCTLDAQCKASMGDASFCNRGRCECLPHNHFSELESRCFLNKGLFQMCRNSSECYIGDYWTSFIECSRGQCNCRYGYYVTDNNKCGNTGSTYTIISTPIVLLVTVLLNEIWKSVVCNL